MPAETDISGAPHNALLLCTEGKLQGLVSKRDSSSLPDSWSLIRQVGKIHFSLQVLSCSFGQSSSPAEGARQQQSTCRAEQLGHLRAGGTTKSSGLTIRVAG